MKVLFHSNSPLAPTGYGTQTALFAPLLAEHYELVLSANYGVEGAPFIWKGIPVLPGLTPSVGNETLPGHVTNFFDSPREGLVVTLYDTPVFDENVFKHLNTVCWTPVDHDPVVPRTVVFFRNSQAIPLAMSKYGMEQLSEFDPIYVPHGVNLETHKPTRGNIREQMGISEDQFLIGIVAANKGRPGRKCFQQALEAFRHFRRKHEDAVIYFHTQLSPEFAQGEDLPAMAAGLGIPEESLKYPSQYRMLFMPPEPTEMAELYSAFDVLLNCSMGEGFGVPIIEAAACGTPSIVTGFSAMPEVAGPGWKVRHRPYWTGQASWMAIPDVPDILGALEECHDLSDEARAKLSDECRKHAADYSHTRVFSEHLLPALEEVEERIGSRAPVKIAA